MKYWVPERQNTIPDGKYPLHNQLIWETSNGIYFVDSANPKILRKTTDEGETSEVVTTRVNKDIARGFYDYTEGEIYLLDCDYDDTISYLWKIDTDNDTITEIRNISGDVFDIWEVGGSIYYCYFGSGFTFEILDIDPNGDGGTLDWTPKNGGDHYVEIDDGDTPDENTYISAYESGDEDIIELEDVDLSGYDSGEVYEIVATIHAKGGAVTIDGDQADMDPQTLEFDEDSFESLEATFTGLSLADANIDALSMSIKIPELISQTSITTANVTPYRIAYGDSKFYVVGRNTSTNKTILQVFNTSFVIQNTFELQVDDIGNGTFKDITYYDGILYILNYNATPTIYVRKYDVSDGSYLGYTDVYSDIGSQPYQITYASGYIYIFTLLNRFQFSTALSFVGSIAWIGNGAAVYSYEYHNNFIFGTTVASKDVGKKRFSDGVSDITQDVSELGNLMGICSDGSYLYVLDDNKDVTKYYIFGIRYVANMTIEIRFYGDTTSEMSMYDTSDDSIDKQDMGIIGVRTWEVSYMESVGDYTYFLWKWSDENPELWQYDADTPAFTQLVADCGNNRDFSDNEAKKVVIINNYQNFLNFILKNTVSGNDTLCKYDIDGDELSELGEYDIILMKTDNVNYSSNNESPFNIIKGISDSDNSIYYMHHDNGRVYKVFDLDELVDAATGDVIAITDHYILTDDGEVYEFTNFENKITASSISLPLCNTSNASLEIMCNLPNDATIWIHDDNDIICFIGRIDEKSYDDLLIKQYKCISYNEELAKKKISYAPSAVALNTVIEYLIDQCSFLYYTDTSITANATTITASWQNLQLTRIFEEIADYADWIISIEPDGCVYFNDGTTASGEVITATTGEVLNKPKVQEISRAVNYVKLYGGYVDGARISSIAQDEQSVSQNGPCEYIAHYPNITNQTQLDNLATALLTRTGLGTQPKYITVQLDVGGILLNGYTINFAYAYLELDADDYIQLNNTYDIRNNINNITMSTGLVQKGKNLGAASGVDTMPADEEQLDIVAGYAATKISELSEDTTPQLGGDLDLNGHAIDFPTTPNISDCLDEDTMVSDSPTSLATQQSIKAYADGKVSDAAYGAGWNGETAIAPSKNTVYDVINAYTHQYWQERTGDPAAQDIDDGDMTLNGVGQTLDFDSYITVPTGAIMAQCRVIVRDNAGGSGLWFYATNVTNGYQIEGIRTQVANVWFEGVFNIPLDSNNQCKYIATNGLDDVRIAVIRWLIEE